MTKGPRDSQDDVGYYSHIIKVSGTSDGAPAYTDGADWVHRGMASNNEIDWSPPGNEPAPGSTYYVTRASTCAATPAPAYTLAGHSITFSSPPPSNKAVFVVYIHGTHSDDGSTLAYQQTGAGDGGFNSIYIDDGYTSRYLGKHMAMGIDWLDGYVGLSSTLRQQVMNLLVQWSDYYRDYGYYNNSIQSNYGAGAYVSRMMTALARRAAPRGGPATRAGNDRLPAKRGDSPAPRVRCEPRGRVLGGGLELRGARGAKRAASRARLRQRRPWACHRGTGLGRTGCREPHPERRGARCLLQQWGRVRVPAAHARERALLRAGGGERRCHGKELRELPDPELSGSAVRGLFGHALP